MSKAIRSNKQKHTNQQENSRKIDSSNEQVPRKLKINENGKLLDRIDCLMESLVEPDDKLNSVGSKGKNNATIQRLSTIRASMGPLDGFEETLTPNALVSPLRRTLFKLDLDVDGIDSESRVLRSQSKRLKSMDIDKELGISRGSPATPTSPGKRASNLDDDPNYEHTSRGGKRRKAVYKPMLKDLVSDQTGTLVGGSVYFKIDRSSEKTQEDDSFSQSAVSTSVPADAKRLSNIQEDAEAEDEEQVTNDAAASPRNRTTIFSRNSKYNTRSKRLQQGTSRPINLPIPSEARVKTLFVEEVHKKQTSASQKKQSVAIDNVRALDAISNDRNTINSMATIAHNAHSKEASRVAAFAQNRDTSTTIVQKSTDIAPPYKGVSTLDTVHTLAPLTSNSIDISKEPTLIMNNQQNLTAFSNSNMIIASDYFKTSASQATSHLQQASESSQISIPAPQYGTGLTNNKSQTIMGNRPSTAFSNASNSEYVKQESNLAIRKNDMAYDEKLSSNTSKGTSTGKEKIPALPLQYCETALTIQGSDFCDVPDKVERLDITNSSTIYGSDIQNVPGKDKEAGMTATNTIYETDLRNTPASYKKAEMTTTNTIYETDLRNTPANNKKADFANSKAISDTVGLFAGPKNTLSTDLEGRPTIYQANLKNRDTGKTLMPPKEQEPGNTREAFSKNALLRPSNTETIYMTPITPLKNPKSSLALAAQKLPKAPATIYVESTVQSPASGMSESTHSSGSSVVGKVIGNVSGIPANKRNLTQKTYGQVTAVTPLNASRTPAVSHITSPVQLSVFRQPLPPTAKTAIKTQEVPEQPDSSKKGMQASPKSRPSVFDVFGSTLKAKAPVSEKQESQEVIAQSIARETLCASRVSLRASVRVSSAIMLGISSNYLRALVERYTYTASPSGTQPKYFESCAYCGSEAKNNLITVSEQNEPKLTICRSHYDCAECGTFLKSDIKDYSAIQLSVCERLCWVELTEPSGQVNKVLTHYFCTDPAQKHCTRCWKYRILPKLTCSYCCTALIPRNGTQIEAGTVVHALGKYYHRDHFRCSLCSSSLCSQSGDSVFNIFEDTTKLDANGNGSPICESCFDVVFSKTCTVCAGKISEISGDDDFVEIESFLNKKGQQEEAYFHHRCFKCTTCSVDLADSEAFQIKGELYCSEHYNKHILHLCDVCGEPFSGPRLRLEEKEVLNEGPKIEPNCKPILDKVVGEKDPNGKRRTIASEVFHNDYTEPPKNLTSTVLHVHMHCAVCNHCCKSLYHPVAISSKDDPSCKSIMDDYRLQNNKLYCKECYLIYFG